MPIKKNKRRLFFGAEVDAPWSEESFGGRVIDERSRHLTLAFLGELLFTEIEKIVDTFPVPSFKVGIVGESNRLLLLPKNSPRAIAYLVDWVEQKALLEDFQKNLIQWLAFHHLPIQKQTTLLSHITFARAPFKGDLTKMTLSQPIPFTLQAIHLYESVGNLHYQPVWSYPLIPPFEELEHIADIAFRIYAEKNSQLHLHAQYALAFKFPSLLPFVFLDSLKEDLDEIIIALNQLVTKADQLIGSPLKAVSFHGSIERNDMGILQWEMIVDV